MLRAAPTLLLLVLCLAACGTRGSGVPPSPAMSQSESRAMARPARSAQREGGHTATSGPDADVGAERPSHAVPDQPPPAPADDFPRVPPTPPDKAIETFRLARGFRLEIVAAEPLVADPIDMAFDEDGRLFVVEMTDYPFGPPAMGRIRVLEDTDGDGRMDRSTVFADGLSWPDGLACWDGGVLVAAAPDVLYLKDTDSDGRADVRRVVLTGFARKNVQYLVNGPRWGPGNAFWLAGGGAGGSISSPLRPGAPPADLHGADVRFRPDGTFEAVSGGGQYGATFDDFGRRFVCENSRHARHVVLDRRTASRNPALGGVPVLQSIASDGDSAEVFRISPPEAWRVARTRMRVAGQFRGPIEHGGRVTGYFTSACGLLVFRGAALGDAAYGNLFVAEPANNLVHRKTLAPAGSTFRADRADPDLEFLASTDVWFRPVNLANGPDGALYVCDMYREVIEHPETIPESVRARLDLTSGSDRGRIWRVVAEGAPRAPVRPRLSRASTAELVEALGRRDAWWRDTTARLLIQRRDTSAAAPLEALAREGSPESRAAALEVLDGLAALNAETLRGAMGDASPGVREVALRLAGPRLRAEPALLDPILALATDPSSAGRVRLQLACALGESDDPRAVAALARLAAAGGGDDWLHTAILSSLGPSPAGAAGTPAASRVSAFLEALSAAPAGLPGPAPGLVERLMQMIGTRGDPAEVGAALAFIVARPEGVAPLRALCDALQKTGRTLDRLLAAAPRPDDAALREKLRSLFDGAAKTAADDSAPAPARVQAVLLLAHAPFDAVEPVVAPLLEPRRPPAVRDAAVRLLGNSTDPRAGPLLLESWRALGPALRPLVLDAMSRRPEGTLAILDAVEKGKVAANELDPARRRQMLAHPDERVRAAAGRVLGAARAAGDRRAVVASYGTALERPGDAGRGKAVFAKNCAQCHKAGGEGQDVGPDLASVRAWPPERILEQVLDPNREVNPAYVSYTVVTVDGLVLSGILTADTEAGVTLKHSGGAVESIPRAAIDTMASTGMSLMPEGLETAVDVAAMADVIAFLRGDVEDAGKNGGKSEDGK